MLRQLLRPSAPLSLQPGSALAPVALGLALTLLAAPGCRAVPALDPLPAPLPLHWPTSAPPPVQPAQPVLWVSLGPRLGPAPGGVAKAAPLVLQAAAGELVVTDADGQRLSGSSVRLRWQEVPLAEPFQLARTVLGPFASFESAEQAATAWRELGVTPVIAHPAEWEVWAPAATQAPAGLQARQVEQRFSQRLVLTSGEPGAAGAALKGPLRITAPGGLRWEGGVFQGPFRLASNAYGGWTLIEEVPLERYLLGVVPHEIGAGSPPAALAAQAVLARTWSLRNKHRYATDGYHLCADTQCQVYADPRQAGAAVRSAIQATRGQVLTWQGEPIHAVYHATNGGMAAGFEEVWSGSPLPYLQAAPDGPPAFNARFAVPLASSSLPALLANGGSAYGAYHPRFRWQRLLTTAQVQQALTTARLPVGTPLKLSVLERGPSGRVMALAIEGSEGRQVLRRDAIRRTFRQLPSTLFELRAEGAGRWRFNGGGFGHGAGLSQAGAIDLAGRGWTLPQLLSRYYPGTQLQPLEALGQGL